jgi:hypothetical protein
MWRGAEGAAAMRAAGAWRGEGSSGNRRREKLGAGDLCGGNARPIERPCRRSAPARDPYSDDTLPTNERADLLKD